MGDEFRDNAAQGRYEYVTGDAVTYARYRRENGALYIDYVEAPPELRGKGTAGKLMEYVTEQAKAQNLKIVPICGYAAAWLRRNGPG